jgi:hypothetical protein
VPQPKKIPSLSFGFSLFVESGAAGATAAVAVRDESWAGAGAAGVAGVVVATAAATGSTGALVAVCWVGTGFATVSVARAGEVATTIGRFGGAIDLVSLAGPFGSFLSTVGSAVGFEGDGGASCRSTGDGVEAGVSAAVCVAGAGRRSACCANRCAAGRVRTKPAAYTVITAADPSATRLFVTRSFGFPNGFLPPSPLTRGAGVSRVNM